MFEVWDCIFFLSSPRLLPLQTLLAASCPSQGCAAAAGGDAVEQGWLLGQIVLSSCCFCVWIMVCSHSEGPKALSLLVLMPVG